MNKAQLKIIADRRKAKERRSIKEVERKLKRDREIERDRARVNPPKATADEIEAFHNQPLTPKHQRWAEMEVTDVQLEDAIASFQKGRKSKYRYAPRKLTVKAYQDGYLTNGQFSVLINIPSSYIIRSDKLQKVHLSSFSRVVKYVGHLIRI